MQFISSSIKGVARRPVLAAAIFGFTFVALPVYAEQATVSVSSASQFSVPEATLAASASMQVSQDSVRISLSAEAADKQREKVGAAIEKALESVIKQAKAQSRVKVSSGNYRVWPVRNEDARITGWQGRAEVFLESTDLVAAAELAGQLSDRVGISNVYFFVSRQAREAAEAALLEQAAQAFRARADAVAASFGYQGAEVKALTIDGGGADHAPMPRMLAASAPQKSVVPIEPGEESVTVSVRGSVYLLPKNK